MVGATPTAPKTLALKFSASDARLDPRVSREMNTRMIEREAQVRYQQEPPPYGPMV